MLTSRMIHHADISETELRKQIRQQALCFGGNTKLKIYGKLNCSSGKRMLEQNRVFFSTETEAKEQGFRPCGHCMKNDYKKWKNGFI